MKNTPPTVQLGRKKARIPEARGKCTPPARKLAEHAPQGACGKGTPPVPELGRVRPPRTPSAAHVKTCLLISSPLLRLSSVFGHGVVPNCVAIPDMDTLAHCSRAGLLTRFATFLWIEGSV